MGQAKPCRIVSNGTVLDGSMTLAAAGLENGGTVTAAVQNCDGPLKNTSSLYAAMTELVNTLIKDFPSSSPTIAEANDGHAKIMAQITELCSDGTRLGKDEQKALDAIERSHSWKTPGDYGEAEYETDELWPKRRALWADAT